MELEVKKTVQIENEFLKMSTTEWNKAKSKKWISADSMIIFYQDMWDTGNMLSPNELREQFKLKKQVK